MAETFALEMGYLEKWVMILEGYIAGGCTFNLIWLISTN